MSVHETSTIAVIGAGTMGHGIAQIAAQGGYSVWLHDLNEDLLARAQQRITHNLTQGITRGKLTEEEKERMLAAVQTTTRLEQAVASADLVIEAIVEDLNAKRDLLRQVETLCPAHTVLATNTSSLSIAEIASPLTRPERLIGMHFFNPAHIMKLLEIVLTEQTSETALQVAREVGARMKKEAIVVRDVPGFATSRLGICLGLEAMRMLEEGVASAADIDKALELGYNHPMGPLRLTDLVGLDIRLSVAQYLHSKLGERFRPPEILKRKVAEGKLGKKTGEGFYRWDE